ncbi:MAG: hypothetical protein Q8936_09835 [Bacillota bacterium]|nr:hypothetical protein [Bacillota bacterium]
MIINLRSVRDDFEKVFISTLSIVSGIIIAYLSILGPLFLNKILYKTSRAALYQMQAQDLTNLIFISPILILAGILLLLEKSVYKHLLILSPISTIYYALSYTLGMEWSSPIYTGNSEKFFYYFLFLIVSSLIIMFYAISRFDENINFKLNKKFLVIYSIIFILACLAFASMWMKEVNQVINIGTTTSYNETPTLFWVIRCFDLGFTIPLGFISLYLLWTRPSQSLAIQLLFYGFFLTTGIAVNAMGFFMYINDDPAFSSGTMVVFLILLAVICSGYIYILKNYKQRNVKRS